MNRGNSQITSRLRLAAGASFFLTHATLAEAQFHGHPGFGSGPPGSGSGGGPPGGGDGGSGSPFGPGADGQGGDGGGFGGPGAFGFGPGFDVATATRYRVIHGILAALAFVILFPMGSILMRIIPGRFAIWIHGLAQLVAYIIYIAAAALGFWMIQEVQIPRSNGSLLTLTTVNYHPIIGIVVLVTLFFQPFFGLLHHSRFKKIQRRQIWSHLHLWNGRLTIPLGIVNGGLGLRLAGAGKQATIAYIAVAAIMVAAWIIVAMFSEYRRARANKRAAKGRLRRLSRSESAKVAPSYR